MNDSYKADQVGSFLRPTLLKEAHAAHQAGELSLEALRNVEDVSILRVLEMQQKAGIDVVSDGEYRRLNWSGGILDAVEGFVDGTEQIKAVMEASPARGPRYGLRGRVVGARLKRLGRITDVESSFLSAHAKRPYKVTMPSPSYVAARAYLPGLSDKVYPDKRELLAEIAEIMNQEVRDLIAEGVTYIQFDNPHFPDYVVEERREQLRRRGIDPDQAMRDDIAADNAAVEGIDRDRTVIAAHLCRGNGPGGTFHTQGGYDAIAEELFATLDVDRILLEYDSERSGGFEPLRFLPKHKTAVLGLITTKSAAIESKSDLLSRFREAEQFAGLDQLAVSPQCGFASVIQGNPLSWEEQEAKLSLVVSLARTIWGAE